ncbi:MAG: carbon-nitrogen hydrolase family protein [Pseudomonadota bacterium]
MNGFGVAGLQLPAINGDNVDVMEAEIDSVKRRFPWVRMVVLGELNGYGSDPARAQAMPGAFEQRFREVASRNDVWLLPGSIMEAAGDLVHNTCPVIDPDGEVIARYRKQFPWLPYEKGVTPGDEFVVFDVDNVGRFGVSICYDMWFPETIRAMTSMGAEVILHPSLTSTIDRDAEKCMVRAHGAMHQCYVFDVNVAGPLGVGSSLVAGPGGEIVYEAGEGRDIFPLMLDLDYVRDVRENGWQGLGQPLKSYRDSTVRFPQYAEGYVSESLNKLGPMALPGADHNKSKPN